MTADTSGGFHTLMPVESGFKIIGDARKLMTITAGGEQYLVGAVNNGNLQIFRVMK
jgi:hypothetical protein